jgi:hypothetical protein
VIAASLFLLLPVVIAASLFLPDPIVIAASVFQWVTEKELLQWKCEM